MPGKDAAEHALPEGCAQEKDAVSTARRTLRRTADRGGQGAGRSRAHVARVKAINADLRRIILQGRRAGLIP